MTHSIKTAKPFDNWTDEQRIAHIRSDKWIGYTAARNILATMEELRVHPRTYRMPNLLLVAPTNNGKTVLLNKFFGSHKPVISPATEQLKVPVLYVQAPPVPNDKMLYFNILEALNAPYNVRGNPMQLYLQVTRILRRVENKILIIDEIQHVLAGSHLSQKAFLNAIKSLGNELQIVIIGAGVKDAFSAISTDKQLANRFEPAILPTWKLNEDYFRLLSSYEAMLPLHEASELTRENIALKILSMSGGTIGEIATILKKAAVHAIREKKERIDLKILGQIAYYAPDNRQRQYEQVMI
jgi:hypothetical protein